MRMPGRHWIKRVTASAALGLAPMMTLGITAGAGERSPVILSQVPADPEVADLAAAVREELTADGLAEQLAAIVQHDRLSGTAGENAAIDHVVDTLRAEGIPVDVHEFDAYLSDPLSATVEIPGAGLAPEANTVAFSATTVPEGLEAEVVDVGGELPDLDPSTGDALSPEPAMGFPDVSGKIALVDGTPRPDAAWTLEQMGAVGAIFVNPEERLNELVVTTVWGAPSLRNRHRIPSLVVTQVKRSAGEAIREHLGSAVAPVTARLTTEMRAGWRPVRLAVARIEASGQDPPLALLGGHIDSWFLGATDEGASNAAMVELARGFWRHRDRLRRSLWVAWWPGHSNGRYAGSTWFADHRYEELQRRAVAYLNVDGIGQIDAARLSASVTAALEPLAREVVRERAGQEIRTGRPGRNSDQAFNGIGMPLLQFNHSRLQEDGGYWWWHTAEDTIDKIDPEVLEVDAELYVDALARLLAARVLPVDLTAEVEALGESLAEARQQAGDALDLSSVEERRLRLLELCQEIETLVGRSSDRAFDRELVRVLRPLYRVQYTLGGIYHPDPAVGFGRLPGLAPAEILAGTEPGSHRYQMALTTLVRERNRLVDALDEATRQARTVLEAG